MTASVAPRFVFVLGTGRCGSSLVHEVLARHPDVGFVTNVEDRFGTVRLGAAGPRIYRALPPSVSTKGRLRFAPSEAYGALAAQVSPALERPTRDLVADDATPWLSARTRTFFESHAQRQRTGVFIHKFTGWPRAGFLQAIWPDAAFIHIVRDGRAVVNSLLQMPWWSGWSGPHGWTFGPLPGPYAEEWEASGRSFVTLAALEWKVLMDAFAAAAVAPGTWLELRYEDVVADPRGSFAVMLEYCNLAWTPAFERGFARYHFSQARQDAYRKDLGLRQVALLDACLKSHLERHGYQ